MNLIIKNGVLVTAGEVFKADILATDGKIEAISTQIDTEGEVIDAEFKEEKK